MLLEDREISGLVEKRERRIKEKGKELSRGGLVREARRKMLVHLTHVKITPNWVS